MMRVQIIGAAHQTDSMKRIRTHLGVLDKPLREVGALMLGGFKLQFDSEGVYGTGAKWKALTAGTKLGREKAGFSAGPILNRSGALKRSWTDKSSPYMAQKVTNTSITLSSMYTVGKGKHYLGSIQHFGAKFMHPGSNKLQAWGDVVTHGTKAHSISIPARPMMGYDGEIPDDLRGEMNRVLERFIDGFIRQYG